MWSTCLPRRLRYCPQVVWMRMFSSFSKRHFYCASLIARVVTWHLWSRFYLQHRSLALLVYHDRKGCCMLAVKARIPPGSGNELGLLNELWLAVCLKQAEGCWVFPQSRLHRPGSKLSSSCWSGTWLTWLMRDYISSYLVAKRTSMPARRKASKTSLNMPRTIKPPRRRTRPATLWRSQGWLLVPCVTSR